MWNFFTSSGERKEAMTSDLYVPKGQPLVDTLPTSPYDGQKVDFQTAAMADKSVVWALRYNAGSAKTYKWENIGSGWWEERHDAELTVNGTYSGDPSLTIPLNGVYVATFGSANNYGAFSTSARTINVALSVGGTVVTDSNAFQRHDGAGLRDSVGRAGFEFSAAAGNEITIQYDSGGVDNQRFDHNYLSILPVRVAA